MQRLLVVGLLLLAGVAGSWTGTVARGIGEGSKKESKADEKGACDNKVCAVAKLLDLGAYCHYYAIRCPNIPVALAAPCNTPYPRFCGGNCDGCVDVGEMFALGKAKDSKVELYENQITAPYLVENGIPVGTTEPNPATVLPAGSTITTFALDPFLVTLKLPQEAGDPLPVKVKLYTVRHVVDPTRGPNFIFGAGLHVDTSDTPPITIAPDNILRTNKHAVTIIYGNVTYQIILCKGTQYKPIETATKARR